MPVSASGMLGLKVCTTTTPGHLSQFWFLFAMLGMEPRPLHRLGRGCSTEPHLQPHSHIQWLAESELVPRLNKPLDCPAFPELSISRCPSLRRGKGFFSYFPSPIAVSLWCTMWGWIGWDITGNEGTFQRLWTPKRKCLPACKILLSCEALKRLQVHRSLGLGPTP